MLGNILFGCGLGPTHSHWNLSLYGILFHLSHCSLAHNRLCPLGGGVLLWLVFYPLYWSIRAKFSLFFIVFEGWVFLFTFLQFWVTSSSGTILWGHFICSLDLTSFLYASKSPIWFISFNTGSFITWSASSCTSSPLIAVSVKLLGWLYASALHVIIYPQSLAWPCSLAAKLFADSPVPCVIWWSFLLWHL